jgi:hypothetical protein
VTRRECPACHHYCYYRCRYCGYVRPIKPKPDHRRKTVMGVRFTATGVREHKTMSSRKAAQVLGGQKGGLAIAAAGTAHRWTPETARKAAVKSWTKVRKFNKRINARVGVKANRRKALWRAPLRAYYAENPTRGIHFENSFLGARWLRTSHGITREISERAALTALGHLSSPRGYIPDSITPVPRTGRSLEKRYRPTGIACAGTGTQSPTNPIQRTR